MSPSGCGHPSRRPRGDASRRTAARASFTISNSPADQPTLRLPVSLDAGRPPFSFPFPQTRGVERRDGAKRVQSALKAPTHPCDRVRRRRSALHGGDFWPEVASVTGHGAGAGGSPRAPWDPGCEPGVLGRRWSAPLQDRLMKAPLIEQTASLDTFCLLFVNNF